MDPQNDNLNHCNQLFNQRLMEAYLEYNHVETPNNSSLQTDSNLPLLQNSDNEEPFSLENTSDLSQTNMTDLQNQWHEISMHMEQNQRLMEENHRQLMLMQKMNKEHDQYVAQDHFGLQRATPFRKADNTYGLPPSYPDSCGFSDFHNKNNSDLDQHQIFSTMEGINRSNNQSSLKHYFRTDDLCNSSFQHGETNSCFFPQGGSRDYGDHKLAAKQGEGLFTDTITNSDGLRSNFFDSTAHMTTDQHHNSLNPTTYFGQDAACLGIQAFTGCTQDSLSAFCPLFDTSLKQLAVNEKLFGLRSTGLIKKKRRKKPKDMPRRPLSAYNLFFKDERSKILEASAHLTTSLSNEPDDSGKGCGRTAPHHKISFELLAQTIGKRWKATTQKEQQIYKDQAKAEMERYRQEIKLYKEKMKDNVEVEASPDCATTNEDNSIHPPLMIDRNAP